jgi:ribonuclease R
MKGKHHQPKKHREQERTKGTITTTGKGVGFVPYEQNPNAEDIMIESGFLNTALNGDDVEIVLHPKSKDKRQTGEVVKIIRRHKINFVGTLKKSEGSFFLVPDDRKMYTDIFIPQEKTMGGEDSDKAYVKILFWDSKRRTPEGEVLKVLGKKGEHEVEMESIIIDKGIEQDFPADVTLEAETVEEREKPRLAEEITKRRDMRFVPTFTIDPKDAKDFDDAISIEPTKDGMYEIGVHIADVSHYVREKTALDREARKRAFSVYLVDRTIPMLPEVLSNDLCSLNPREDKLSFSAVFKIDKNAHIHERWFGKTVINSNKRFSYEEAQAVLNKEKVEDERASHYFEQLSILNTIAKKLRHEKMKKGAIDFEQDEVKFVLDEKGHPIRVIKKQRLDTHKLVEEYMLLANKEVAEFIYNSGGKKSPISLYRIHDLPDKDKIAQLSIFLKALGHTLEIKGKHVSPKDIAAMLSKIEGRTEEALIKTATIRSMAKAIYSTKNIGHFGLAFEYYTHFTSPIRRYADLMVHRVLENILSGNKKQAQDEFVYFSRIADEVSQKETAAAEAERASIKYKQVEFMLDKVGQEFNVLISGVTDWGIYVEDVETRAEGMVRLRDMNDDYYQLDEKTYSIKGTKTGKKYTLGDKTRVKLMKADLDSKTLDFQFI